MHSKLTPSRHRHNRTPFRGIIKIFGASWREWSSPWWMFRSRPTFRPGLSPHSRRPIQSPHSFYRANSFPKQIFCDDKKVIILIAADGPGVFMYMINDAEWNGFVKRIFMEPRLIVVLSDVSHEAMCRLWKVRRYRESRFCAKFPKFWSGSDFNRTLIIFLVAIFKRRW